METFAGRPLEMDEAVYRSESETGFRNRAIGWMLRNFGVLKGNPTPVLENYFRQCSMRVTCRDLGLMAATLANNGVHPITAKSALLPEHAVSVLSVMSTCGMYDYAGSWLYEIGMPAKSGVAGGVLAVVPGRFGLGVFSPRVDDKGNSVRGVAACQRLSRDFGLHMFSNLRRPSIVLRREYSGAETTSRRVRPPETAVLLRERASRVRLLALQGDVALAGAEYVGRRISGLCEEADSFILDMHRVSRLDASAAHVLQETRRQLAHEGRSLVYSCIRARAELEDPLKRALHPEENGYLSFEDNDLAMEWCENRLLASSAVSARVDDLSNFPLFARLCAQDVARIRPLMRHESYRRGTTIIVSGDLNDDRIFLLLSGEVSVILPLPDGTHQRVSTLSPGMNFGEVAVLGHSRRTATVYADTDAECWVFNARAFDRLAAEYPHLKIALLENLSQKLADRLRQNSVQISALAS
jgi:glutaminase